MSEQLFWIDELRGDRRFIAACLNEIEARALVEQHLRRLGEPPLTGGIQVTPCDLTLSLQLGDVIESGFMG